MHMIVQCRVYNEFTATLTVNSFLLQSTLRLACKIELCSAELKNDLRGSVEGPQLQVESSSSRSPSCELESESEARDVHFRAAKL